MRRLSWHFSGSLMALLPVACVALVLLENGGDIQVLADTDARVEREDKLELDLGSGVKLKLMRIPAAGKSFWMGSPQWEKNRNPFEKAFAAEEQHQVEFTRDFWLAATETTQAQYKTIMGKNPSWFCSGSVGKEKVEGLDTSNFPVEMVSWEDAQDFCSRLNDKFRGRRLLFRLPSEAEWEYGCRGGASSKDSLPFHFKDGPSASLSSRQANCNFALERTCRVSSYEPNRFGLYDMHGNVWEWCQDWYGPYSKLKTNKDPIQDEKQGETFRGLRGGSRFDDIRSCRAANRNRNVPSSRGDIVGFRVAWVEPPRIP